MLALIGTIPYDGFPILSGEISVKNSNILIGEKSFQIKRGFKAMIGAASIVCKELSLFPPTAFTAGDIGLGDGSKRLYEHLRNQLSGIQVSVLTFHYLMPDIFWHDQIIEAIEEMSKKPILIADAGFMYVAKMSGFAPFYDLFTPDIGELAFLADELAPHPFYTRGFICHEENNVPSLISRAYKSENASKFMIVKGENDYICSNGEIIAIIKEPNVETLEPIGGTGDTLTGIVSALVYSGYAIEDAAVMAAIINRLAGELANPSPSTQVSEIISYIPKALSIVLKSLDKKNNEIHVKGN